MKLFIKHSILALICASLFIPSIASAQSSLNTTAENISEAISILSDSMDSIGASLDSINSQQVVIGDKNNEQWIKLEQARLSHKEEMMEYYVGIIAIIVGCAMLILICVLPIFFICYFIYRKRVARYRIIEKAIENKIELPEKILAELETSTSERQAKSPFESAMVWVAWGIGIMLFFIYCNNYKLAGLCVIPLLVGIAKLITYFIERKNNNTSKSEIDNNADPI